MVTEATQADGEPHTHSRGASADERTTRGGRGWEEEERKGSGGGGGEAAPGQR